MSWQIDARIPVTILEQAPALNPATALLAEEALPEGVGPPTLCAIFRADELIAHPRGCACCNGQGAAAAALAALFRERALGGAWFSAVVAVVRTPAGRAELEEALRSDILTLARYRLT
jgi:hypothetical protein